MLGGKHKVGTGTVNTHIITINQPVDYMARDFMILMRGLDITRAIGRVALKVEPVLGPEIARQRVRFGHKTGETEPLLESS